MESILQGVILAFREGLEAFLVIVILLKFLEKTNNDQFKKNVWYGVGAAIVISLVFGAILVRVSSFIGGTDAAVKLWESVASLVAVGFIITFIVWMIKHGSKIKAHVEGEAALNMSQKGIFSLALFMVLREGVEIALFQFAGRYSVLSIIIGLALAVIFVVLIYYSLVKIKITTIFNITLAYLILQAGFLLGYSVHEGLSAAKELGLIAASNPVLIKAFDLSTTLLNHKEGILGLPLYVLTGWYSRPEWIQFALQYGLTGFLFLYWYQVKKKEPQ